MPSTPRHHALLVGIDLYPKIAPHPLLRSCANDARLIADVLAEHFRFKRRDMRLLLDAAATRDAVLAGLADLHARVRPGDGVVLFWSGHGSQIEDIEGDEPDGTDETLVPSDSGRGTDENLDLIDDELYAWILSLGKLTTNVAVILDTCFSGGALRGGAPPREGEKWIAPGGRSREGRRRPRAVRSGEDAPRHRRLRDLGPSGFLPVDERYVLLAACRYGEHAKELTTRPYSAFTWHLARELGRAGEGATYLDVNDRVKMAVAADVKEQTPQVEGAHDRVLFGLARHRTARHLPVLERSGDRVVLGGGAVQGVGQGSLWGLYPAATRDPRRGVRRAVARIETVASTRAEGRIVEARGRVMPGLRAFEREKGPGWLELPVTLDGGSAAERRTLAAAIRRSPLLALDTAAPGASSVARTTGGTGGVRVAAVEPEGRDDLVIALPSWLIESVEGELLRAPIARRRTDAKTTVVDSLEGLARIRSLLALADVDDASLRARVNVEILASQGAGPLRPAPRDGGGEIVLAENDRFGLRIVHRASVPLFIHVLDVGLSGAVKGIYPLAGGAKPLAAGRPLDVGEGEGEELDVTIPAELVDRARAARRCAVEGRESLLVFATETESDLSGWEQPGWRGLGGTVEGGGLAGLLARVMGRGALRGPGGEIAPGATGGWALVVRSFRVRR